MRKNKNRQYSLEFKQQAAELAIRIGTTKAADQLGVPMSSIHEWKADAKNKSLNLRKQKLT